jgi:hypothetical protein
MSDIRMCFRGGGVRHLKESAAKVNGRVSRVGYACIYPTAQAANTSPVICPKSPARVCPALSSAHTHSAFVTPAEIDRYKIPNACESCHADKPSLWASEALKSWNTVSPWRMSE